MLKKIFIGLFIPALALAQPRLDTTSSSLSASNARVTQVIFADGTTQTTAGVSGNTTVTNLPDTLVYRNISNAWSAAQTLPAGSTILGGPDVYLASNNVFTTTNVFESRVGIGTNNPQTDLHVAGDARVDGNLAVNGNQVTMDGFDVIKYNSGNTGRASINSAASAPSAGTYNAIISNRDSGSSITSGGSGGNVILGGSQGANTISGAYSDSVVLGGGLNDVVSGNNVIIAGGYDNEIRGTGNAQGYGIYNSRSSRLYAPAGTDSSVIIGGVNSIITNSFGSILLKRGTIAHNKVFMYSDSGAFVSGNSNTVLFNASNGFGINTNNPQADLHVNGMVQIDGVKVYASGTNLYLTDGSSFTNLITTTPL